MNKKTVLTCLAGVAAGMLLTAGTWLVYPRLHAMLPSDLAKSISTLVLDLRHGGQKVNPREPGPAAAAKTPATRPKPETPVKLRPGQPKPYYGALPSVAGVNIRDAALDVVYKGLMFPWSMEFMDSETLLIAEQVGRLQRLDLGSGQLTEITGLPEIPERVAQLGLLDVALHPDFGDNQRIYFSYSVKDPESGRYTTALSTAVIAGDQLQDVRRLVLALPYAESKSNFGGAIAFDDDGYLYFATGDKSMRNRSQKTNVLNGKVLRLHDDGRVPEDNPFVDRPDIRPEIYALGVRNPQGLVFDSRRGLLFETEHGPMGGDEVNIIRAGANYGWPEITHGMGYKVTPIGVGTDAPGMEQPLYYYLPSIAASPLEVYYGEMFPEWQGHLLVGALKGAHVSKLDITDGGVQSAQRILNEVKGRVRDIKVAADGSIYLLIQNGGRVLRLHRDTQSNPASVAKVGQRTGEGIYHMVCITCHGNGTPGVPQHRDRDAWSALLAKGKDTLYRNTINGINAMPPKGLCEDCTDEELRRTVNFLVRVAEGP